MANGYAEDVARRAFDAVAAADRIDTIDELNLVLEKVLSPMGFDVFGGVNAIDSKGRPNVQVLFGKSHPGWVEHYQGHAYAKDDAMIREMISSTDPLFWSDLASRREVLPQELRIINEAADFGLTNGFVTPLQNIDGSMSAVLLMGRHIDPQDPDIRAAAHLLSIHYGGVARRIHQRELARASNIRLSARQLECLKWVRAGKSTNDIADILDLSSDTVKTYIERACHTLGVRTRTQAVCEAALHGLLQL